MSQAKYYFSGETVILYDNQLHKQLRGILLINNGVGLINKPQSFFIPYKIVLAGLFLSLLSLMLLLEPIILGEVKFYAVPTHQSKNIITPTNNQTLINFPKSRLFQLNIPKINLSSNVAMNVDSNSPAAYKLWLKEGIAHAKGSYLPGQEGTIYLFAHSSNSILQESSYSNMFLKINDLVPGDLISLFFQGKNYQYSVTGKEIVNLNDVDIIRNSSSNLILSTCWPPQTDWQRLIVKANLI